MNLKCTFFYDAEDGFSNAPFFHALISFIRPPSVRFSLFLILFQLSGWIDGLPSYVCFLALYFFFGVGFSGIFLLSKQVF